MTYRSDTEKQEKIQEAIGLLDDDLLEEVDALRRAPQKKTARIRLYIGAAAACLCLLVGAVAARTIWTAPDQAKRSNEGQEAVTEGADPKLDTAGTADGAAENGNQPSGAENVDQSSANAAKMPAGVTIAPMRVVLGQQEGVSIDMAAFFIYEGRSYEQYGTLQEAEQMVGDYLGTATGLIDEWTEEDGYIDYAGSVKGDFYAVNGFDPQFVLCMKGEEGAVEIYINNNDLTLYTGADLLSDRFHLNTEGFSATCMSHERWFNAKGDETKLEPEETEAVRDLVEAMLEAPFLYADDTNILNDTESFHLYLYLDNGMMVHLRLFEGGYIQLNGFRSICLQVDETVMDQTCEFLQKAESAS